MRKVAVISTNDNPDYLFYLPMVVEGWFKLGYDVFILHCGDLDILEVTYRGITSYKESYNGRWCLNATIKNIEGIDNVTLTQCARLFAAYFFKDEPQTRLMTSDTDMLVLRDIFEPSGTIDTWGHDLTGFAQVPICYISMTAERWIEVMGIDLTKTLEENMARIIKAEPFHNSNIQFERWSTDQEIITKRLKATFYYSHNRDIEPGSFLPKGRLDQYDWKRPSEIIDVHLPRDPLNHYGELVQLAGDWFPKYFEDFKAYINGKQ